MARRSVDDVVRLEYWREPDARVVVNAWRRSGDSQADFARRHGFKVKRLRWWASRLNQSSSTKKSSPARPQQVRSRAPAPSTTFHPIKLVGEAVSASSHPIEIELTDGRLVRVHPGFDARDVERLLSVTARAER